MSGPPVSDPLTGCKACRIRGKPLIVRGPATGPLQRLAIDALRTGAIQYQGLLKGPRGRELGITLEDFVRHNHVVIHLGAHKTATTYIQSSLKAKRDDLYAAGVALVLPSDLRNSRVLRRASTDASDQPTVIRPNLPTLLDDIAADPTLRRITISEESIIGSPRKNLTRMSLYPDIKQRLEALPRAFDHPNTTFLFALRDYGSFVSSNITTAVRRGNLFDLESLRTAFLALHRDWIDAIGDLQESFPSATIKAWRYEQFQALEKRVFAELVEGAITPRQTIVFKTLSGNAMRFLYSEIDPDSDAVAMNKLVTLAAKKFPVSASNPPYSLWTDEQAAHMTHRYDLDWQEICKNFPGIALQMD